MFENIKRFFGIYKPDYEYWVNIKEIKIKPEFERTTIGINKWIKKLKYFQQTGDFQSRIILNSNWELIDGYSSYKIAVKYGLGKVPVYFEKYKL